MILFLSDGRLGNQLFQYSFLRTIAKENENIIALHMDEFVDKFDFDNSSFKNIGSKKYFNFIIKIFVMPLLIRLARSKVFGYVKQDGSLVFPLPTYTEKRGLLPLRIVDTDFFQSEKFFKADKVDVRLKENYLEKANKIFDSVPSNYQKVFVHVRRGDYLFESYLDIRGIDLPRQYYLGAIKRIKKEVENPYFVFVSDDPGFVECCFEQVEQKYISKNCMAIDLALMSLCEYGIVSNSSFSWWGAYLMKNRKKVIFPKYWWGWKNKKESHIGICPDWAEELEVSEKGLV